MVVLKPELENQASGNSSRRRKRPGIAPPGEAEVLVLSHFKRVMSVRPRMSCRACDVSVARQGAGADVANRKGRPVPLRCQPMSFCRSAIICRCVVRPTSTSAGPARPWCKYRAPRSRRLRVARRCRYSCRWSGNSRQVASSIVSHVPWWTRKDPSKVLQGRWVAPPRTLIMHFALRERRVQTGRRLL